MAWGGNTSSWIDTAEIADIIEAHELPAPIIPLLDQYDGCIGDRNRFFWQWLDYLFPVFTLSSVDPERLERVQRAKLLASIIVTVLDDVAEKHDDRSTLREAAKVPFPYESPEPDRNGVDGNIVRYVQTVWEEFEEITPGPREEEFMEIMRFDLRQVFTAIEYSYIANHHLDLVTESELMDYDVHNMAVFVYADLDLMASPTFANADLSNLRDVIRHAERTARIANWVTTWERELGEGDCSSGVVVYALSVGIVSLDELEAIRENATEEYVQPVREAIQEHDIEEYFQQRLEVEFAAARERGKEIDSVDIDAYLDGFATVQEYHRAWCDQ